MMKKSDRQKVERAKAALDKAVKLLGEVDDSLKAEIAPSLDALHERGVVIRALGNTEQAADYLDLFLNPEPSAKE
jgi:hypothetical protein